MISPIMFVGILVGTCMIYFTYIKFKRKEITGLSFAMWLCIWLALIITAIFPGIFHYFAKDVFDFQRPLDLMFILGFLFLIGLCFFSYCEAKSFYRKISELEERLNK